MLHKKSALLGIAGAAVLALVLSLLLASRAGKDQGKDHPPAAAGCPVEALTCAPGQFDRTDSATPGGPASNAGGDAKAPGVQRASPSPSASPAHTAGKPRPTSGPCASFTACGFPDARTTGPRLPFKEHKTEANMEIRTDNTVIRGWDLTGSLDIYANNVTVIDSRITSTNWWGVNLRPKFHGLRVLHNTITAVPGKGPDNGGVDYAVSNMGGSVVEVGWNNVSVFGDALSMGQGNLHDNYVHGIVPFINLGHEWQHTNAVISDGGGAGELIIRHNTLLNSTPITQGASASVGLYADVAPVTHTTVEDNWIAGGSYAFYGGGKDANHIKVTGNVFSTEYHKNCGEYGPVTAWNFDGAGNVWSANRGSDGKPVVPQRA